MQRTEDAPGGATTVDAGQVVADLLKCWVSVPAMVLRQQVGLLPQTGATQVRRM
jgi:hypothetical protein